MRDTEPAKGKEKESPVPREKPGGEKSPVIPDAKKKGSRTKERRKASEKSAVGRKTIRPHRKMTMN